MGVPGGAGGEPEGLGEASALKGDDDRHALGAWLRLQVCRAIWATSTVRTEDSCIGLMPWRSLAGGEV